MIRFYKPTLKRGDMDSVLQTMVNEQIGPGERCSYFTSSFAEKTGCQSSVAFRTYPDCIESALRLAGAEKDTAVAISPLSPSIYKEVLDKLGCKIVWVDVDKENGLVNETLVASSGAQILILYENCGSIPLKYNKDTTFADKCDFGSLVVIEDVTQSIGGHFRDEAKPGDWGKIVICALEEDNIISSAGGAVLAVKSDLTYALRSKKPSSYLRLPDMNAALGLVQLNHLDENCIRRREILKTYQQSLSKTNHRQFGLTLLDFESCAGSFSVFLDSKPEQTIKFAEKHDIPTAMTFEDCLLKDFEGDAFSLVPAAAAYYYRTVSFPVYPFLKASDVDSITKIIAHLP